MAYQTCSTQTMFFLYEMESAVDFPPTPQRVLWSLCDCSVHKHLQKCVRVVCVTLACIWVYSVRGPTAAWQHQQDKKDEKMGTDREWGNIYGRYGQVRFWDNRSPLKVSQYKLNICILLILYGKKNTILSGISSAFCSHMPASYNGRLHEYSNQGCIRTTGLYVNNRGQI